MWTINFSMITISNVSNDDTDDDTLITEWNRKWNLLKIKTKFKVLWFNEMSFSFYGKTCLSCLQDNVIPYYKFHFKNCFKSYRPRLSLTTTAICRTIARTRHKWRARIMWRYSFLHQLVLYFAIIVMIAIIIIFSVVSFHFNIPYNLKCCNLELILTKIHFKLTESFGDCLNLKCLMLKLEFL